VLVNLLRSGFQGVVYPVNAEAAHVAGVRAYPTVADVPDDIDLVVVAVPAPAVIDVIEDCARKRVRGLVVMSGGFSEEGPAGLERERTLVSRARANGMRVIGPNCLGIMNTAAEIGLNATLAATLATPGRAGFFSEAGALGLAVLDSVGRRGIGLSTLVSAGNRADVSGNDLLQYWEDDPATNMVLLHLESVGNARKFARLARRLGRRKPIVAVRSRTALLPLADTADPDQAVDALFRQAGVVRVDTLDQLLDVAQVLATQPLPAGRRVAVVGNSAAPGRLTAAACTGNGLEVAPLAPTTQATLHAALGPDAVVDNPLVLPLGSGPAEFHRVLTAVLEDPGVDAVVTVFLPMRREQEAELAAVVAAAAKGRTKPLISTFLSVDDAAAPADGEVVSFRSPEVAVAALAKTAAYAEWRRRPEGTVPAIADIDEDAARALVTDFLSSAPQGGALSADDVCRLLAAYGVPVRRAVAVASVDSAAAEAAHLGYPVALKATAEPLRHRPDLGTVRLDIADEEELRAAYQTMTARLGAAARLSVQAMAPPGVATVIRTADDPSFGAVVSFGLGGVATELLGDRGFRVLPLTDRDAAELVRSVRAAPLLFGYRGSEPVDVAALEALLLRVARLADDLPEVAELELNPVIVAVHGTSVLGARARVGVSRTPLDAGPRRLH
jgi:acyl-CoA synthetase (NDP forming)